MQLTAVNYFQSILLQQSRDDVIITLKTIQKLTCCSDSSVGTVNTVHPEKPRYFLSIPEMSSKNFYSPNLPDCHRSPATPCCSVKHTAAVLWSWSHLNLAPRISTSGAVPTHTLTPSFSANRRHYVYSICISACREHQHINKV